MLLCSNIYYEQVISDLSWTSAQLEFIHGQHSIATELAENRWNYLPWNPMWCTQVSSILASSKRHQLAYFTTYSGYQFPIVWPPVRKKGGQWSFPHRSASNLHGQWRVQQDNKLYGWDNRGTEKKARYFFMHIFISSVGDTSFQSVKNELQNTGNCTC
jgi:hypothetical protein